MGKLGTVLSFLSCVSDRDGIRRKRSVGVRLRASNLHDFRKGVRKAEKCPTENVVKLSASSTFASLFMIHRMPQFRV